MSITISKNLTALAEKIRKLPKDVTLDAGEKIYVGERQRTRILRRTESGRDVDGAAFAPYSTTKFYWSPNGRLKGATLSKLGDKKQKAAVKRFAKKIDASTAGKSGAPHVSKSGLTICFPGGYRQFKKYLGRTTVDLRGAQAPHMLQAIQVKSTAEGVKIGIYGGEKGSIAAKHNLGAGRLPKREFFGVSRSDEREVVKDAEARIRAKLGNVKL